MPKLNIFALLLCLCLAPGCTLVRQTAKSQPQTKYPVVEKKKIAALPPLNSPASTEAAKLVGRAIAGAALVRNITARASFKAIDKPANFTFRCRAQLSCSRPDSLRLIATKGINTLVMDLSMVGNGLDIMLPTKKKFYRGLVSDLSTDKMNFHPQEIVNQILLPDGQFARKPWTFVEQQENKVIIAEKQQKQNFNILTIEPKKSLLLRRQIYSPNRECLLDVTFSRHKPIRGIPDTIKFPHKFVIKFPLEQRRLFIVLRKITANQKLPADEFWITVPDASYQVKALKSGNKLTGGDDLRQAFAADEEQSQ